MKPSSKQRGVALITALLVVAIATIAAVEIAARQRLDIRRTQNTLARDQAYDFLVSAEAWVLTALKNDLFLGAHLDHLGETWARPIIIPSFEGASLSGRIEDLQGRFNLNSLSTLASVPSEQRKQKPVYQRFHRLLENLNAATPELKLDDSKISQLIDSLIDWMDPDLEPNPYGAEDDFYLRQDPPYRAANQLLASPSELQLINGFRPQDNPLLYQRLAPHVSALSAQAGINVNTAQPQVLMSLSPKMTEALAKELSQQAQKRPWETVQAFMSDPQVQPMQLNAEGLQVNSHYFGFVADVTLGPAVVHLQSTILRGQDASISVLSRSRSDF